MCDVIYCCTDDEDRLREELKDLIDDNPIEESDGEDSDGSGASKKRKKSDDEEYDDRLEDEDYDLIEENLGVKVERRVNVVNSLMCSDIHLCYILLVEIQTFTKNTR